MKPTRQLTAPIYIPSTMRMLPFLLMTAGFALVDLLVAIFWPDRPTYALVLCLVLLLPIGCQFALVSIAILYRMVHPFPAVTISDDGLVDNASLLYRGVGLLRWSEIAAIIAERYHSGVFTNLWHRRFLVIVPTNWPEYEHHLPQWLRLQRVLLRLMVRSPQACICIPQFMLPTTADEVAERLRAVSHYRGLYEPSQRPLR